MSRNVVFRAMLVALAASALHAADISPTKLKQAEAYYRNATRALQSGNLPKAKTQFEKALEAVPMFPEAHIGLGTICLSEKDAPGALRHYEQARDGYAEVGDALFDLKMRRYRETRDEIQRLQEQINQMRQQQSRANQATGDPTGGEAQIRAMESRLRQLEAVDLPVPDQSHEPPAEIFFHIGNAQFRMGSYDEARKAWETCAEKNPEFPLVHNNLAVVYWKAGMIEKARASLAKAEELGLEVNPQFKADLAAAKAPPR